MERRARTNRCEPSPVCAKGRTVETRKGPLEPSSSVRVLSGLATRAKLLR
jgi:hypothetical protein